MLLSEITSLKLRNYKCFDDSPQGFEKLLPINVIVGRNNAGKSALLDSLELLVRPLDVTQHANQDTKKTPTLLIGKKLTNDEVIPVFPDTRGIIGVGGTAREYGMKFIGADVIIDSPANSTELHKQFSKLEPGFEIKAAEDEYGLPLVGNVDLEFNYEVKRLSADRDINPEVVTQDFHLEKNGEGATSYFFSFQRHERGNETIIENEFIPALNEIFHPFTKFNRIDVKKLDGDQTRWEVYLYEEGKKSVKLSNSGSGFKTIILVLINLLLVPDREGRDPSQYIFCFEEIENNLHPGLQRRLFEFIKDYVRERKAHVFLTTHSSVLLDSMQTEKDVQTLHVSRAKGGPVEVRTVATSVDNNGIIDDLDVRASDLLQANSIVWVEGPSDKVYIRQFIDLYTGGQLEENLHYQIVFYGGRLLAHLEYGEGAGAGVNLLKVNRHSIMVMDSDFSATKKTLTPGKKKMKAAINSTNGICWITNGREIENYISKEVVKRLATKKNIPQVTKFGKFDNYLSEHDSKLHKLYKRSKSLFADKVSPSIQKEDLNILDLNQQLKVVCTRIAFWNGIKLK